MTQMTQSAGNTNSALRARKWCFTINNPTSEENDTKYYTFAKKFVFQLEKGENETEHLQGVFELANARTFASMKKQLPHAHIEKCKNWPAAVKYCQKDESRIDGPWTKGMPRPLKVIKKLYPWQTRVIDMINKEADDRTIHWWVDEKGGAGKTQLAKYITEFYNALVLNGKRGDALFGVTKWVKKEERRDDLIVIFDFVRSIENYVSYEAIESIKNGLWYNTKFECEMVRINSPHVICFSNFMPEVQKLTKDRWKIYRRLDSNFVPLTPDEGGGLEKKEL